MIQTILNPIWQQLPNDVVAKVLSVCKTSRVVGDMPLDWFLINNCTDINPESLLQAFVKKRRTVCTLMFFSRYEERHLSYNTIKQAISNIIKRNELDLAIFLCTKCPHHAVRMSSHILRIWVQKVSKCNSIDDLVPWFSFLHKFLNLTHSDNTLTSFPWLLLDIIVRSPCAEKVMKYLMKHNILDLRMCIECNNDVHDTIRIIIILNKVGCMSMFIANGYKVTIDNIIQGIVYANINMNRVLLNFFRPRFFSVKFGNYLEHICQMRGDVLLHPLIVDKLGSKKRPTCEYKR